MTTRISRTTRRKCSKDLIPVEHRGLASTLPISGETAKPSDFTREAITGSGARSSAAGAESGTRPRIFLAPPCPVTRAPVRQVEQ